MNRFAHPGLGFGIGLLCIAGSAAAQRSGNIARDRYAVDIAEEKFAAPAGDKAGELLASVPTIQEAARSRDLVLLYLYDQSVPQKRPTFEQVIFSNLQISISLRCFRCCKIDVSTDPAAKAAFGRQVPLFIAFNQDGKRAGEVSMPGYRAVGTPLVNLLSTAASGRVKPSLPEFVRLYHKVVSELDVVASLRNMLRGQLEYVRDNEVERRNDLEKDMRRLEDVERKLLAAEKDLLDGAKVPTRGPGASRIGR